jgi:hypothetical protein
MVVHKMPGGSWKDSSRNAVIKGDVLEAELRNGTGHYVLNRIRLP